jgi:hypothetical protein
MVVEKHYIGNKVEFRQYPPLVDKFLQYARTTCPHVIHKLWITNLRDEVIQSENTNIISNKCKWRNALSRFIHNCNNLLLKLVHK